MRIVALILAHNEEACVADSIRSVWRQTRSPDYLVDNRCKKAGALNQVLKEILPGLEDEDAVLIMDADSILDEGFAEYALRKLSGGDYGGVGGTFRGRKGGGFVGGDGNAVCGQEHMEFHPIDAEGAPPHPGGSIESCRLRGLLARVKNLQQGGIYDHGPGALSPTRARRRRVSRVREIA